MPLWLIATVSLAFGFFILISLWFLVTKVSRQARSEWLLENPGKNILLVSDGAHCAAFPGERVILRGSGLLILTPDELHFKLWAPRRDVAIPLKKIFSIDIVKSFAGRWGRLPMLHIAFEDDFGRALETAWSLPGAKRWVEDIIEKRKGNPNG